MAHCSKTIYWVGNTTERFTIHGGKINESSNLELFDPNNGTNTSGALLDFSWIFDNFNTVNKFTFKGERHHIVDTISGDSHVLMILPTTLEISNIGETVLGTIAGMTEGLHYDSFQLIDAGIIHNAYYIRDLSNLVLPRRQFQFDVAIS